MCHIAERSASYARIFLSSMTAFRPGGARKFGTLSSLGDLPWAILGTHLEPVGIGDAVGLLDCEGISKEARRKRGQIAVLICT